MENVILVIHLLLALTLIGVVLLQRSEGGGLGMGGGGGGGVMSGRAAATALGKITWGLAIAFICTSLALTILATRNAAGGSVVDRLGGPAPAVEEGTAGADQGGSTGADGGLLPPGESDEGPVLPDLGEADGNGAAQESSTQDGQSDQSGSDAAQVPTAPAADEGGSTSGGDATTTQGDSGSDGAATQEAPAASTGGGTDSGDSSGTPTQGDAATADEAPAATAEDAPAATAEEAPAATTEEAPAESDGTQ